MRMIKFSMILLLLLVFLTGCSSKEKYLAKEEALAQGSIVLNGTMSENRNRFDIFLKNVDAGRDDSIKVYIYDLKESHYVISITYTYDQFEVSSYFMDKESNISKEVPSRIYTDLIMTSSKNIFLVDRLKVNPDLWIYQYN
ncbi:MAG: hypothetical protein WBI17_03175 [Clostridiaceae bacterium]